MCRLKRKKNAKDPFKPRNVVGIVKERRALNFYRVEWKKNGKCQVSTLYAGMLSKRRELAECQTGPTLQNPLTHRDIADEVSIFSYLFRLNHKVTRQPKKALLLENVEMDMKDLWSALNQGVGSSIISSEAGDREEARAMASAGIRGTNHKSDSEAFQFLFNWVSCGKRKERDVPNNCLKY